MPELCHLREKRREDSLQLGRGRLGISHLADHGMRMKMEEKEGSEIPPSPSPLFSSHITDKARGQDVGIDFYLQ